MSIGAEGGDSWRVALSKDLQVPVGCPIDSRVSPIPTQP